MTPLRCLALVLLPVVHMAHAADPAPARNGNTLTIPGGQPTGKVAGRLTRDQLRQCLLRQKVLTEQEAESARTQAQLQTQQAEIARRRAELEQAGTALDAERAAVDATQAAAVEAFNAKLQERRQRLAEHEAAVAAYNARLTPYNAQVEVLNASRVDWAGGCADRTYDEADYFAIQRGK